MKTVTGKITSSKPISVSKAAKILSKFVSSDTCASPAISVYLSRASEALDELAQFHKSKSKSKSSKSQTVDDSGRAGNYGENGGEVDNKSKRKLSKSETVSGEDRAGDGSAGNYGENGGEIEGFSERKRDKKKKKKKKKGGEFGDKGQFGELSGGVDIDVVNKLREKTKKKIEKEGSGEAVDNRGGVRDNVEIKPEKIAVQEGRIDDGLGEGLGKTKKRDVARDNEIGKGDGSKKRKIGDVEEEGVGLDGSEESRRKKKRKIKSSD